MANEEKLGKIAFTSKDLPNEEKLGKIAFASNAMITLTMPRHMLVQWPGVAKIFTLDLGKFDARLVSYGFAHGVKQKAGDQFGAEKARTPEAREAIIEATLEQLRTGEWNKKGRGEGAAPKVPEDFDSFLLSANGLLNEAKKLIKDHPSLNMQATNTADIKRIVDKFKNDKGYREKIAKLRKLHQDKLAAQSGPLPDVSDIIAQLKAELG